MNRYLRRLLWRQVRSQLAFDWNPTTWLHQAETDADNLRHDLAKVWDWVIKECSDLGQDIWHDARNWKGDLTSDIWDIWNEIYTEILPEIWGALGSVGGDLDKVYHWVIHEIESIVDTASEGLRAFGWDIWHDADKWYHDALNFSWSTVDWLYHHVVRPIVNELWRGIRDVEHLAEKLGDDVWHDLILKAIHDAGEAWADAHKALFWIDHGADDAYHLVVKAWDWLEYFAAHPFAELEALPRDVVAQFTPASARMAGAEVATIWGPIAAELEAVFNPPAAAGASS